MGGEAGGAIGVPRPSTKTRCRVGAEVDLDLPPHIRFEDKILSDAYARAREFQMDVWADQLMEIANDSSKDHIEVETPDGRI